MIEATSENRYSTSPPTRILGPAGTLGSSVGEGSKKAVPRYVGDVWRANMKSVFCEGPALESAWRRHLRSKGRRLSRTPRIWAMRYRQRVAIRNGRQCIPRALHNLSTQTDPSRLAGAWTNARQGHRKHATETIRLQKKNRLRLCGLRRYSAPLGLHIPRRDGGPIKGPQQSKSCLSDPASRSTSPARSR